MPNVHAFRATPAPVAPVSLHSAEAEHSVLGALLLNAATAWPKVSILEVQDFFEPAHGLIFASIAKLMAAKRAVDIVTVHEELSQAGKADDVGGIAFLNELAKSVPTAAHAADYAAIVTDRSMRRRNVTLLSDPGRDAHEVLHDLQRHIDESARAPFARVPLGELHTAHPPSFWWDGRIPAGVVTLLGAHGGVGKSFISLMLAACIATGSDLFGVPTRRGRVVFFSAEDPSDVLRHRLKLVCDAMDLDPIAVARELLVLDVTEGDPVLYREATVSGARSGMTTATFAALTRELDAFRADVLIVDNASDTFDASEIDRARVRGFMRALGRLAHPHRAVLLLAHVDKSTARGERGGAEGYSGSTAWHNSARSRLFLKRDNDGFLTLEHQKINHGGSMAPPLRIQWLAGELPRLEVPTSSAMQEIVERNDMRALLVLIAEFADRGESVPTAVAGPFTVATLLGRQLGYPKGMKPGDAFELLREAERRGLVARQSYANTSRKTKERWQLSVHGMEFIGRPAPVAPVAPIAATGATIQLAQQHAPVAPVVAQGVIGGLIGAGQLAHGAAGVVGC